MTSLSPSVILLSVKADEAIERGRSRDPCAGVLLLTTVPRTRCMSQTSSKPFGPIRNAYAFFQQHATETQADIRAYLPHIHGVALGDSPLRMLDFGCGDGGFTAALLDSLRLPPERLRLALVEPDDVYRPQAVEQLQPYSTQPVAGVAGHTSAPAYLLRPGDGESCPILLSIRLIRSQLPEFQAARRASPPSPAVVGYLPVPLTRV